jgi:putative ABC transport system substrate-binding protein
LVLAGPANNLNRKLIAEAAIRHRLPALFQSDMVDEDDFRGLLGYGTSLNEAARLAPTYVDQILKGANPGDMPVQAVTHQVLTVNLDTARSIGVTIPLGMLQRADRVIDSRGK